MSATTPTPAIQKAVLKSLAAGGQSVPVHFNPASLVYTVENSTKQQTADPKRRQFAAQFSAKLTMDLQFDTTGTGEDVRKTTILIAQFMQASSASGKNPSSKNAQAQPVVSFQWGSYEFKGTLESFKETIDFFSAEGIPLRALVSIGLARQDEVISETGTGGTSNVAGPFSTTSNNSLVPTGPTANPSALAATGGDPTAARALASSNGLESLRFTGGASLSVGAGIQLNAAAGFSASAGAGAGAGAGLSIGGGAGLSVGGGAGLSIGGSAGISAGAGAGVSFGAGAGVASGASLQLSAGVGGGALFGARASAGVPATAGAFAGLETGRATISSTARLNPLRMLPATVSTDVSTGSNASFSLGGAANAGSGFSSDVGASFNFNDRLVFDQE